MSRSDLSEAIRAAAVGDIERRADGSFRQRYVFRPEFPGFSGHFPGRPILPAVLQIMAASLLVEAATGQRLLSAAIERAKFVQPIVPGAVVEITCRRLPGAADRSLGNAHRLRQAGGGLVFSDPAPAGSERMRTPYFAHREGDPPPLRTLVQRRVRFEEVDPMGIVWHGRYVGYFEDGRVALGSRYGIGYEDFFRFGVPAPIRQLQIDYLAPLRFGDEFTIEADPALVRCRPSRLRVSDPRRRCQSGRHRLLGPAHARQGRGAPAASPALRARVPGALAGGVVRVNPVWVVGTAAVTALGDDLDALWDSLLDGQDRHPVSLALPDRMLQDQPRGVCARVELPGPREPGHCPDRPLVPAACRRSPPTRC